MKSYEEALQKLMSRRRMGKKISLEPLRLLLPYLGVHEEKMNFIHIAGTNGKGSTASTCAAILAASGLKVGLFTSPYLLHFTERIRIWEGADDLRRLRTNSRTGEIAEAEVLRLLQKIESCVAEKQEEISQKLGQKWEMTFFEELTALGLCYFAQENCDGIVLETGLGGRLDSTNVISRAVVTGITALNYDHCDCLGYTLAEIAREKAAIIKPGTKVFAYEPQDSCSLIEEAQLARKVLLERAQGEQVPIYFLSSCFFHRKAEGFKGQKIKLPPSIPCANNWGRDWQGSVDQVETPLLGGYQALNVSLGLSLAESFLQSPEGQEKLKQKKIFWSTEKLKEVLQKGCAEVYWPGRLQVLQEDPLCLLDGAHNPQGAESLVRALQELIPDQAVYLMCGFLENKDYLPMLKFFWETKGMPLPRALILVPPEEPHRALDPENVAETLQNQKPEKLPVYCFSNVAQAAEWLKTQEPAPLVCWGSLYLAAPVLRQWSRVEKRMDLDEPSKIVFQK